MSVLSLLNQTIVVYPKSSYSAQGREIVGGATNVRARVQAKNKNVMTPTGAILTIEAVVYILPTASVNVEDKVTYSGQTYKVYSKYPAVDGQGETNHYKLELIRWQT